MFTPPILILPVMGHREPVIYDNIWQYLYHKVLSLNFHTKASKLELHNLKIIWLVIYFIYFSILSLFCQEKIFQIWQAL